MSELDDKDLAEIKAMQRSALPGPRDIVAATVIYLPTVAGLILAVVGMLSGVTRVRATLGLAFLAIGWGVALSRSWERAKHQRRAKLWFGVASASLLGALLLGAAAFVYFDVRHQITGWHVDAALQSEIQARLDAADRVLEARRARRQRALGMLHSHGPRPDLGRCPLMPGDDGTSPPEAGLPGDWADRATVVRTNGTTLFEDVDGQPDPAIHLGALRHRAGQRYEFEPSVEGQRILEEAQAMSTPPGYATYLVVEDYQPSEIGRGNDFFGGRLGGLALLFDTASDEVVCAAQVSVFNGDRVNVPYWSARWERQGPTRRETGEALENDLASRTPTAMRRAPWFRAGPVALAPPELPSRYVIRHGDDVTPLSPMGLTAIPGTDARVQRAPQDIVSTESFLLAHPVRSGVYPQRDSRVEIVGRHGAWLAVEALPCEQADAAYDLEVALMGEAATPVRDSIRRMRSRGRSVREGERMTTVYRVDLPDETCLLVNVQRQRGTGEWIRGTLASLRAAPADDAEGADADEPDGPSPRPTHASYWLRSGRQREAITVGAPFEVDGQQFALVPHEERRATLVGVSVQVGGDFAYIDSRRAAEGTLRVLRDRQEVALRLSAAPSTTWRTADQLLREEQSTRAEREQLAVSIEETLLGAPRRGQLWRVGSMTRWRFAFEIQGRFADITLTHAGDEAAARAWLRRLLDSVTLVSASSTAQTHAEERAGPAAAAP